MPDPEPATGHHLRVSDDDRDAVIGQLHRHAAAGRLTPDELEQRTGQALTARTAAELATLVGDLPPAGAGSRRERRRWFVGIMGSSSQRRRITLDRQVTSVSILASPDIDLCNADISGPQLVVRAFAFIGSPDIYVPDSAELELSGFAVAGGYSEHGSRAKPRPGAPRIRIRCYGLLGRHTIWRLPPDLQALSPDQARKAARALSRPGPAQLAPPTDN